jgi:hypothetical protein
VRTLADRLHYLDLVTLRADAVQYRKRAFEKGAVWQRDPGWIERTLAENVIALVDAIERESERMTTRVYNFPLPYTVPEWEVEWGGYEKIKSSTWWATLPPALQAKATAAYEDETDFVLTQEDCDSIDDATWAGLAGLLGLGQS